MFVFYLLQDDNIKSPQLLGNAKELNGDFHGYVAVSRNGGILRFHV
jgi:hypothetical protein